MQFMPFIIASHKRLEAALKEYMDAGDNCVTADDGVAAMLRFGEATDAARAALRSLDGEGNSNG
jgi:hypothetical protein